MKFKQYLNEKFEAYLSRRRKGQQSPIPIFLNPTKKEIGEIASGSARYIINFDDKDIYVWDAMEALHATVAAQLKLDHAPGWTYNDTIIENGKLDELVTCYMPSKEKEPNLDWAKPYFNHITILRLK